MQGGYSPNGTGGAQSDYYGSIGYGTTYGAVTFGQMSWRGSQAQLWGGPGSPPSVTPHHIAFSSNGRNIGSSPSTPSLTRATPFTNGRLLSPVRRAKAASKAHRKHAPSPLDSLPRPTFSQPQRPVPLYSSTWGWSPRYSTLPSSSPRGHMVPRRSVPSNGSVHTGVKSHKFSRYRVITNNL